MARHSQACDLHRVNLPLLFARRYLLAKRSTNAINIITGISIVVIAVVTAAMVVVLSTLNGIADLVDTIYSPFDQDITITAAEGKTFARGCRGPGAHSRHARRAARTVG